MMARFPGKDVSSWLGNSVPVAMRHHAMATEASFLEACDPKVRPFLTEKMLLESPEAITKVEKAEAIRKFKKTAVASAVAFQSYLVLLNRWHQMKKPPFRSAKRGFL